MSLILYEWRDHPVHNLLGLGAQYQMEPGSNRSTKESSPHPKGGLGYGGGVVGGLQLGAGDQERRGASRCCNLTHKDRMRRLYYRP